MFQGFSGSSFSIGKAWESLEQLVAPIPGDEETSRPADQLPTFAAPVNDDDAEDSFESVLLQHIQSKREDIERAAASTFPESPASSVTSFTTIALEDESPQTETQIMKAADASDRIDSSPSFSAFLSNSELEKRVQHRYREQLEKEIESREIQMRVQKTEYENQIYNILEERDFWMKKVAILEQNGQLEALVESQQQDIENLHATLQDLSAKLRTSVETNAAHEAEKKQFIEDIGRLRLQIAELESRDQNDTTEVQHTQDIMAQLKQQQSENRRLLQANQVLLADLSDKELELQQLRSNSDLYSEHLRENESQKCLQQQLLEESERTNDNLRAELETTRSALEEEIAALQKRCASLMEQLAQGGVKSQSQHNGVDDSNGNTVSKLEAEVRRLLDALTESENTLKETEELAWKHKAETAEILWAYEKEQTVTDQLRAEIVLLKENLLQGKQSMEKPTDPTVVDTVDTLTNNEGNVGKLSQQSSESMDLEVERQVGIVLQDVARLISTHYAVESTGLLKNTSVHPQLSASLQVSAEAKASLNAAFTLLSSSFTTLQTQVDFIRGQEQHLNSEQKESKKLVAALLMRVQQISSKINGANGQGGGSNGHSDVEDLWQTLSSGAASALLDKIEEAVASYATQVKQLSSEILTVRAEKTVLQDQLQRSQLLQDQLTEARSKLASAEDEQRKLHQVITQLRSLRRTKDGEEQSAQQEVAHLRHLQQSLAQDNDSLRQLVASLESSETLVVKYREQIEALTASNHQLESTLRETKRYLAVKEKQFYDQSSALDVAQSEQRLLRQEISLRLQEIGNLQDALAHIESEHQNKLSALRSHMQSMEVEKQVYAQSYAAQQAETWKVSLQDAQRQCQQFQRQAEDATLMLRQEQLAIQQEKKKMQSALEDVVRQLRNSSQDVIDRVLVANLVVSYFQRRRSREVLQLIANVLAFTDEQLVIVGLKVAPVSLFSSLLSSVIGPAVEPVPVEGDNLAELWVNYLINQASCDEAAPGTNSSGNSNKNSSNSSVPGTPRRGGGGVQYPGFGSAPPSPSAVDQATREAHQNTV